MCGPLVVYLCAVAAGIARKTDGLVVPDKADSGEQVRADAAPDGEDLPSAAHAVHVTASGVDSFGPIASKRPDAAVPETQQVDVLRLTEQEALVEETMQQTSSPCGDKEECVMKCIVDETCFGKLKSKAATADPARGLFDLTIEGGANVHEGADLIQFDDEEPGELGKTKVEKYLYANKKPCAEVPFGNSVLPGKSGEATYCGERKCKDGRCVDPTNNATQYKAGPCGTKEECTDKCHANLNCRKEKGTEIWSRHADEVIAMLGGLHCVQGLHATDKPKCFYKNGGVCTGDHCQDGLECDGNACVAPDSANWASRADELGSCGTKTQCTAKCVADDGCRQQLTAADWEGVPEEHLYTTVGEHSFFKKYAPCTLSRAGTYSHCELGYVCSGGICQIAADPHGADPARYAGCGANTGDCKRMCTGDVACSKAFATLAFAKRGESNALTTALKLNCLDDSTSTAVKKCFYTSGNACVLRKCKDGMECANNVCKDYSPV